MSVGVGVQTGSPLQTSGFFFHLLPNNNEGEGSVSVGVGVQTGSPLQKSGFFYHLSDSNLGEGSEGEGGGSGLPLYQTVTEFFTTSLTPSFCNDRLLNMKY